MRTLAVCLLALVLCFGSLEVVARIFPHVDEGRFVGGFVESDPDLIWRLRPMSQGPLRTNELGFRDDPYDAAADLTILILGDSVSWGDSVGDPAEVYPQRLEEILAERRPERRVEVINASVPGYATFQERRFLERDGLALDPDVIVVQFSLNDVVGPYRVLAEYGGDNYFMGIDTRHGVKGTFGFLLQHARAFEAAVRGLQRLARNREAYDVKNLTTNEPSPELAEAWRRVMGDLDGIQALAAARSVPVILLIVPYRFQLDDPRRLRRPQDVLIAYARRTGLAYLDLLPYLAVAREHSGAPMFLDPSHLSVRGHAVTAQALSARVPELGMHKR